MEEKELERLTATKLREVAKQYENITGVHAMKKEQLIVAIRQARGEDITTMYGKDASEKIGTLKKKIKLLGNEKEAARESKDTKKVSLLRKKIKRFRRLTRKMAHTKA